MAFTAIVASTVVSAGVSYYQGQQQKKQQQKQLAMQKQANADAARRAKEAKEQSEIEMNKANPKRADVSALSSKEQQAALVGSGGTLLTGNQGVPEDQLTLGGNTLLGG